MVCAIAVRIDGYDKVWALKASSPMRLIMIAVLVAGCSVPLRAVAADSTGKTSETHRIGATTTVVEATTGMPFPARVDTGATSCSIHCEAIEIKDPAPEPKDNVGKRARVLIKNDEGKEEWIKTKIADHVIVRTSEREDERYKVSLKLRWKDVEKKVLVTLNDREKMKYPMLIGRNFLSGDFLVDVSLDSDE